MVPPEVLQVAGGLYELQMVMTSILHPTTPEAVAVLLSTMIQLRVCPLSPSRRCIFPDEHETPPSTRSLLPMQALTLVLPVLSLAVHRWARRS